MDPVQSLAAKGIDVARLLREFDRAVSDSGPPHITTKDDGRRRKQQRPVRKNAGTGNTKVQRQVSTELCNSAVDILCHCGKALSDFAAAEKRQVSGSTNAPSKSGKPTTLKSKKGPDVVTVVFETTRELIIRVGLAEAVVNRRGYDFDKLLCNVVTKFVELLEVRVTG
ncbi:hypothetical protein HK101_011297 [Irineochytrium annulatum]|nr:hypothetical protein HK101_011297 [Irineochytrium annulatum]